MEAKNFKSSIVQKVRLLPGIHLGKRLLELGMHAK